MPTLSSEELDDVCLRGWAIPPTPRMLENGNSYYTCSKCGNKVHPPTLSSVPEENIEIAKIFNTTMSKEAPGWVGLKFKSRKQLIWITTEEYTALTAQIKSLINQQIKSVLDELEKSLIHIDEHICRFNDGEQTCDCYKEADDITRAAIQKIRSRYE